MKVIIAEDDLVSRHLLQARLEKAGHVVTAFAEGGGALASLLAAETPTLAVLDCLMPGLSGLDICRRVRATPPAAPSYLILLTCNSTKEHIVAGLEAGADDYIAKPFEWAELQARIKAGERVLRLQENLAARVRELEDALTQVKTLKGLLPICCYCKRIRDDGNYWEQVEAYFARHSDTRFSHSICPDCLDQQLGRLGTLTTATVTAVI